MLSVCIILYSAVSPVEMSRTDIGEYRLQLNAQLFLEYISLRKSRSSPKFVTGGRVTVHHKGTL